MLPVVAHSPQVVSLAVRLPLLGMKNHCQVTENLSCGSMICAIVEYGASLQTYKDIIYKFDIYLEGGVVAWQRLIGTTHAIPPRVPLHSML